MVLIIIGLLVGLLWASKHNSIAGSSLGPDPVSLIIVLFVNLLRICFCGSIGALFAMALCRFAPMEWEKSEEIMISVSGEPTNSNTPTIYKTVIDGKDFLVLPSDHNFSHGHNAMALPLDDTTVHCEMRNDILIETSQAKRFAHPWMRWLTYPNHPVEKPKYIIYAPKNSIVGTEH